MEGLESEENYNMMVKVRIKTMIYVFLVEGILGNCLCQQIVVVGLIHFT